MMEKKKPARNGKLKEATAEVLLSAAGRHPVRFDSWNARWMAASPVRTLAMC